jgi:hypothetical protein
MKNLHGAVKFQDAFVSWKNPVPCKIICMEIFGILRCRVFGKISFHVIAGHRCSGEGVPEIPKKALRN